MFKSIGAACVRTFVAFALNLPDLLRDVVGLAGVALIAYGAWLVYEPAGYIVAGALMLVGVIMNSFGKSHTTGG